MKYKYKFSVIIPIYNVEEYLEETIESVINQTIGFLDNIQIVLVNDGSPDNSEDICLKYTKLYPDNIFYVKQENAGVSAARNKGLEYALGEYINFLDSDDKWECDVFEKAYEMFNKHNDIDIIGVRQKFFEATNTYPSLDFKFNKDKVVDIFNEYSHIQLSVTSAFIRTSAIDDVRFDVNVKYSEDAKFLNCIIIKKEKIGIISSSLHLYRKRFSENSAIQTKNTKVDWYLITTIECYKHCFEMSKKKYGYVIPYFQYYVAYDYQYRVRESIPECIDNSTIKKYMEITKSLFKEIDDYIILEQKRLSEEYKMYLLSMKHVYDITKDFKYVNHDLYYRGYKLFSFNKKGLLCIHAMNFKNTNIELIGSLNIPIFEDHYKLYAVINGSQKIEVKLTETNLYVRKAFNQDYLKNRGFKFELNKADFNSIFFILTYKDYYETKLCPIFGINGKLDIGTKLYYKNDNKIYYYYDKKIKVKTVSFKNNLYFYFRYSRQLIKEKQYKVLIYRQLYTLLKLINKKKIWLVSDRPDAANDNGIHMFKYICEHKEKNVKPYFVITKDSKDYDKVKSIGKPIIFNSKKYKIYFLLADKIISSQADDWVTNAFGKKHRYYHDLYNADFVFLQHGIIKDDLSGWLNCYDKNMSIFVTSAKDEYNSIANNGNYGYDESVVKLTGLPRFDSLENQPQKIVAIMPTWRLTLASNVGLDGKRKYRDDFKKSEYFNFYNNLINDKKLLAVMQKNGYKGIFVIHPSHVDNYIDFYENEIFKVINGYANYQSIFKEASILVSDYSSVPFDFAYLLKPVIYTQFDKDSFFKTHLYSKGYFDYERDGFGPVVYDYESTVNIIIEYIENDCKLDSKYKNRIDKFYTYHDQNNSKRVYDEIKKLK